MSFKISPTSEKVTFGDFETNELRDVGAASYLSLRNVKGFPSNHKRIYRIYQKLELNPRIKPKQRLDGEKLEH